MPYKVLNEFIDKKQKKTLYREGDIYPKSGFKENPERVTFLQSDENEYQKVFIGPEIKEESSESIKSTKSKKIAPKE